MTGRHTRWPRLRIMEDGRTTDGETRAPTPPRSTDTAAQPVAGRLHRLPPPDRAGPDHKAPTRREPDRTEDVATGQRHAGGKGNSWIRTPPRPSPDGTRTTLTTRRATRPAPAPPLARDRMNVRSGVLLHRLQDRDALHVMRHKNQI